MKAFTQIIIFSKDRPAQLELLLRSLRLALLDPESARVTVLYKAEAALEAAYLDLARQHERHRFVNETHCPSFQAALLGALDPATSCLAFLVDDQVFLRPFRLRDILERFAAAGNACATISLRMHPGIRFSYCFRTVSPSRTLDRDSLKFNWADEPNNSDWSFVMAVDGNLYRMEDLLPILSGTVYHNPCFLEEQLVKNCPFGADTFCLCQPAPLVVTVPINRTQDTHLHRYAALTDLANLNQAYLQGSRIALLPFWETTGSMVHREQAPLLLAPPTTPAGGPEIIVDGNQSPPELMRALESYALQQPCPLVRVMNARTPDGIWLAQTYGCQPDDTQPGAPASPTPAELADWRRRDTSWEIELLAAELRAVAEHQFPLSAKTWRNLRPVLPPLTPGLTCPPTSGQFLLRQFAATPKRLQHRAFLYSRQIAYSILSNFAWYFCQPFKGGGRDKLVTLFAGHSATLEELHGAHPPKTPWKKKRV